MSLTVLSVAYPFAPVGVHAAGGAEQIASAVERGISARGHCSVVVACEGSKTAGTLVPTPLVTGMITEEARARTRVQHLTNIERALKRFEVDLIHMHGLDFLDYLPEGNVPVLVTLHLPALWYPPATFAVPRPHTWLNCVSYTQLGSCAPCKQMLGVVPNGVPVDDLRCDTARQDFAIALGRLCPEKNLHAALDAAKRAGASMLLAGEVFPYRDHVRYFRHEIQPRLSKSRRFIGPVGFEAKRRLLSEAQCLLQPSLAPETSSLVVMEAMACGTPVVAFPSGALPEIVEHGKTGLIVQSAEQMAQAIPMVQSIDPETCRRTARERFSAGRMVDGYLELYHEILIRRRTRCFRMTPLSAETAIAKGG